MESGNGLRLPQCWNDHGLLEDDPFCDWFAMRSSVPEGRHGTNWDKVIAETVGQVTGGVRKTTLANTLLPF